MSFQYTGTDHWSDGITSLVGYNFLQILHVWDMYYKRTPKTMESRTQPSLLYRKSSAVFVDHAAGRLTNIPQR